MTFLLVWTVHSLKMKMENKKVDLCFHVFQFNTSSFLPPPSVFFSIEKQKRGKIQKGKGKPKALQKGKFSKEKAFARNVIKQKKFLSEICGMEIYIYFLKHSFPRPTATSAY